MAFPDDPLVVLIEAAFGADRTQPPASWSFVDLTSRWHAPAPLTVFEGRKEGAQHTEPTMIGLTMKNGDGALTPEDARSPWWPNVDEGVPMRVTLDPQTGADPLVYAGFLVDITPRWPAGSERMSLVDVQIGGLLREIGRGGSKPAATALRRWTRSEPTVRAYYPLDDGAAAQLPQAVVGPPVRSAARLQPAAGTLAPHMPTTLRLQTDHPQPGPSLQTDAISTPHTTETTWRASFAYRLESGAAALFVTVTGPPDEDGDSWNAAVSLRPAGLFTDAEEVRISTLEPGAGLSDETLVSDTRFFDGLPHLVTLQVEPDEVSVYIDDGQLVGTHSFDGEFVPDRVFVSLIANTISSVSPDADVDGTVDLGGLTVWQPDSTNAMPSISTIDHVVRGRPGEAAGRRAERIATEEDLGFEAVGDLDDTMPMGPQYPDPPLALLRQCERVDDGILFEAGFDLGFRTRLSRYNQDSSLVIDGSNRELGKQFEPVRNDRYSRNEWTVARFDGGEVTVSDEADQARRGRRPAPKLGLGVASDQQLPDRAAFELGRSTLRGLRYPQLTVPLHSAPQLVDQVMATRLGNRVQGVNLPPQHPPDGLDQVVDGILHTIMGRRKWIWQAVVQSAAPWTVAQVGPDSGPAGPADPVRVAPGGVDGPGLWVVQPYQAGTDTSVVVGTDSAAAPWWQPELGPPCSEDPDDYPADANIAGVRARITSAGPAAADDYDRTEAGSWGDATTGQTWTVAGAATGTTSSVSSGRGHLARVEAGNAYMGLDVLEWADQEVLVSVESSNAAGFTGAVLRYTAPVLPTTLATGYGVAISGTAGELHIYRNATGSALIGSASLSGWTSGAQWMIRAQVRGNRIAAKAWPLAGTEPHLWMAVASDSQIATGTVALQRIGSGTGSFDDFQVLNPQRLTVEQQPINGVTKLVEPGPLATVDVWTPARIAL